MAAPLPFEQQLAASLPPGQWHDLTVLVAVSGGADSVALARGLLALSPGQSGRLVVAHFNHRLRGAESDADQAFVVEQVQRWKLECLVGQAPDEPRPVSGDGVEADARIVRYRFLQQTAEQLGARYVVTAHTADDQAETILHHVMRGTGLAGLSGMPRTRPLSPAVTLIRPLLSVGRRDVLAYLEALGQPYREDSSNAELGFTRNRIRHELLPLLKRDYSASVVESLLRLGTLATDAQRTLEGEAEKLLERAVVASNQSTVSLNCTALAGQDRHLVREMLLAVWRSQDWPLQAMGYGEWNLLADMILSPATAPARQILPGAISAHRQAEQLELRASSPPLPRPAGERDAR